MPVIEFPSLREMLCTLIALPSISSVSPRFDQSNRPIIDCLATWLDAAGFQTEIIPVSAAGSAQPEKANLIATLGAGPGGLVLAGHTDTVPYDEGRWRTDPFRLSEVDQRLYGLGTADMKGFFALALEALRPHLEPARRNALQHPLIILATADEESTMSGARTLVELGRPKARYAVIGEPTGLHPVHAHKGIIMEAVHLLGHAGHSSDPALGTNALEGMYDVLGEILHWRETLQARYRDPRFNVPLPTLNLGYIQGGDNPNRICAECELHFDMRPLPGMDIAALREELRARLEARLSGRGLTLSLRALIHDTPPMDTPTDSALIRLTEALTGHPAETAAYCTEGPYLNALGMETVILGPGYIAQAHQPDEYLPLANLQPMIHILQQLIARFCLTH